MEITRTIAVWGSPGSGKSLTAARLAQLYGEQEKETALVFCDLDTPMLPCLCHQQALAQERSLGSIFALPVFQDRIAEYNCSRIKSSPMLSVYGYGKGENRQRFPAPSPQQAEDFLAYLAGQFERVVFDCSSAIDHNMLTAAALLHADVLVRMVTADLKSVSYLSTQLELLGGHPVFTAQKQLKVLNQTRPKLPLKLPAVSGMDERLPYSQALEEAFVCGDLLRELDGDGEAWEKALRSLASAIEK